MLDYSAVDAPPGAAWCREWTDRVDAAIAGWLAAHEPVGGIAVVALGSYARGELCPASDVDLLLVHDGWGRSDLEALVRALCYPLWDAGLEVGHAVRTPREAVRAAAERTDTATALSDRRLVAGSPGLADELGDRMSRWLRRNGARLLGDLEAADAERHARAGASPGMLSPDLKDGAGGLRDLHSLRWAAGCLLGEVGLDPLVGARYLGAPDRGELARAGDTLLAARCALHLVLGGRRKGAVGHDRLRLDLQDEAAARLGMADGDVLLRAVGLAARSIAHVHGRTWPLLLADARGGRRRRHPTAESLGDGLWLVDGLVEIDAGGPLPAAAGQGLAAVAGQGLAAVAGHGVAAVAGQGLAADPALGLRAVAAAARRGVHLGRRTAVWLHGEVRRTGPLPWDADARDALVAALREGRGGLGALADADHVGLLTAHLPDYARVRGRPQRNPLHTYDVDTHGLEAVAVLGELARGRHGADGADVWAGLDDADGVVLATWLHDVGKAWQGDHSVVGAAVASDWMRQMGHDAGRTARVAELVRLHLLLPDAATRRDLDDEHEIAAVAGLVGSVETLDGLYLLSLADARATGPAAWSAWKDSLLGRLYRRVRRVLTADADGPVPDRAPAAVLTAARELLGDRGPALDALLPGLPARYLATAGARQVAEHARLLLGLPGRGELRAGRRPGPADGTVTVTVVARAHAGLLADCAGVLAAHGLPVMDARAFTRADGVALDWFVVRDRAGVDWDRALSDLARSAEGRFDVAAAVARREQRRDARPAPLAAPVPVRVRIEQGPERSRVEVHGPDAPGMLYRLARVLADAGTDVLGARVATLGPEVRDVFFVRPAPADPDELSARLVAAAGWGAGPPARVD